MGISGISITTSGAYRFARPIVTFVGGTGASAVIASGTAQTAPLIASQPMVDVLSDHPFYSGYRLQGGIASGTVRMWEAMRGYHNEDKKTGILYEGSGAPTVATWPPFYSP